MSNLNNIDFMALSLYIHVPFCSAKCSYCSFPVIPVEKLSDTDGFANQYQQAIFRDIDFWADKLTQNEKKPQLYTLYFGGGTPLLFGSEYLSQIIDYVAEKFDITKLAELSIEANPYPYEQTLQAVQDIIDTYSHVGRIRFSFGIQSLDSTLLEIAGRDSHISKIQKFTEQLLEIRKSAYKKHSLGVKKPIEIVYNYDFIAFGKDTLTSQNTRLKELIKQKYIDSFSLYTLELFPGSQRYHGGLQKDTIVAYNAPWDNRLPYQANENSLREDFSQLQKLLLDGGYDRYEVSNYALAGKESLHNVVYRTMGEYLGVGLGAHGFLQEGGKYRRTTSPYGWKNYISGNTQDILQREEQIEKDILIESFFLGLRQTKGIAQIADFESILVDDYDPILQDLQKEGYVCYDGKSLYLTNIGMNVHHHICTKIMKEI